MLLPIVWLVVLIGALITVICIVLHNKRFTHLCPYCEHMYDPADNFEQCPKCERMS